MSFLHQETERKTIRKEKQIKENSTTEMTKSIVEIRKTEESKKYSSFS